MGAAAHSANADPLNVFSFACRQELRKILQRSALSESIRN